eukprot:3648722-Amphidinium_carterae.1
MGGGHPVQYPMKQSRFLSSVQLQILLLEPHDAGKGKHRAAPPPDSLHVQSCPKNTIKHAL